MTLNDIKDQIAGYEQQFEKESEKKYLTFIKQIIDGLVLKNIAPEENNKIVLLFDTLQTVKDNTPKKMSNAIYKCYSELIKICYSDYTLVTKGYYRSLWLALGMSVIGVPLGALVYMLSKEIIYLSVFIPMGMLFGMAIGSSLDKKAEKEERVLF